MPATEETPQYFSLLRPWINEINAAVLNHGIELPGRFTRRWSRGDDFRISVRTITVEAAAIGMALILAYTKINGLIAT